MSDDSSRQYLSSWSNLFVGFSYFLLFLMCAVEIGSYFWWYRKAKPAAERGSFLAPINTSGFQKLMLGIVLAGFLVYIAFLFLKGSRLQQWSILLASAYIAALLAMVNGAKILMKKKQVSRGVNRTVTFALCFLLAFGMMWVVTHGILWGKSAGFFDDNNNTEETYEHNGRTVVVYHDELPLDLADLMDGDFEEYSRYYQGQKTWLASQYEAEQQARLTAENYEDLPNLSYTIVGTKLPFLYEVFKQHLLEKPNRFRSDRSWQKLSQADIDTWGAEDVYQMYYERSGFIPQYLLCYEDILMELSFYTDPTISQRQAICEKSGGF